MIRRSLGLLTFLACLAAPALAQEGHPLVGTWQGEWEESGEGNFLTLILYWDGREITGDVNPGPDSTRLDSGRLDSSDWSVDLAMDVKNAAGETVHLMAQGRLQNIGSYSRRISGTWSQDGESGEFTLVRQGR